MILSVKWYPDLIAYQMVTICFLVVLVLEQWATPMLRQKSGKKLCPESRRIYGMIQFVGKKWSLDDGRIALNALVICLLNYQNRRDRAEFQNQTKKGLKPIRSSPPIMTCLLSPTLTISAKIKTLTQPVCAELQMGPTAIINGGQRLLLWARKSWGC